MVGQNAKGAVFHRVLHNFVRVCGVRRDPRSALRVYVKRDILMSMDLPLIAAGSVQRVLAVHIAVFEGERIKLSATYVLLVCMATAPRIRQCRNAAVVHGVFMVTELVTIKSLIVHTVLRVGMERL